MSSTNENEASGGWLFPFADIHLSTRWVGGGGVLAEATVGKWEPPVDVGVVRLVICKRGEGFKVKLSPIYLSAHKLGHPMKHTLVFQKEQESGFC